MRYLEIKVKVVEHIGYAAVGNKMVSRSSVEQMNCVCGEVVLSCRNRNHLKVVVAGK